MLVKKNVSLRDDQVKALKKLAKQHKLSVASLVRKSVDDFLIKLSGKTYSKQAAEAAIKAAGRFHSGHSNVSNRHDDYLADEYRD